MIAHKYVMRISSLSFCALSHYYFRFKFARIPSIRVTNQSGILLRPSWSSLRFLPAGSASQLGGGPPDSDARRIVPGGSPATTSLSSILWSFTVCDGGGVGRARRSCGRRSGFTGRRRRRTPATLRPARASGGCAVTSAAAPSEAASLRPAPGRGWPGHDARYHSGWPAGTP
jgi:hypothetical protein